MLYSPGDNNISGLPTIIDGVLTTNGGGVPQWANKTMFASSVLTNAHIYVGNTSNVATDVPMSGDATIINSGAVTVSRINGASIPVAGALVTGNVLQVNGANSTIYAPVNVGGGMNYVAGILPIANGGTNSGTGLANNRLMISRGGQIVELFGLNDGQLVVGKDASEPQVVTMNGDITINNTGVTIIGAGTVTTGKILDGTILNADIADGTINLTTKVTNVLPIANGGTGSATQNFVDLTTNQTIGRGQDFY